MIVLKNLVSTTGVHFRKLLRILSGLCLLIGCSNGKIYLGLGNVRAAQELLSESFDLHKKCLKHYELSVGTFHHRTGDGCVKVSDHHTRRQEFKEAK